VNHLLLVDGNHLAHRYRRVLEDLRDDRGQRTGVVFGFMQSMRKIVQEQQPQHVIVVFDYGKSLRKQRLRASYKQKPLPSDPEEYAAFLAQLNELPLMLNLLGVQVIRVAHVEADDIIGLVCYYYPSLYRVCRITIVSSDSDLLQLLSEDVTMLDEVNSRHWTLEYFAQSKYGALEPEGLILYKALMGDASDRIEGCPGIGEKTATWLVQQIEDVYDLEDENLVQQLVDENPRCKSLLDPAVVERAVCNVSLIRLPQGVTDLDREERVAVSDSLGWQKPAIQEEQFNLYAAKWNLMSVLAKGRHWFTPFHAVQWAGELWKN